MTTPENQHPAAAPPTPGKRADLPADVCLAEFERLCRAYRIETSPQGLNSDEIETFTELRDHICAAIATHTITVDVAGFPTLKTRAGDPLVFGKATGKTLLAGDGLQPFQFTRRGLLIGTELTGSAPDRWSKLDLDEFRLGVDIVNLVLLRR